MGSKKFIEDERVRLIYMSVGLVGAGKMKKYF